MKNVEMHGDDLPIPHKVVVPACFAVLERFFHLEIKAVSCVFVEYSRWDFLITFSFSFFSSSGFLTSMFTVPILRLAWFQNRNECALQLVFCKQVGWSYIQGKWSTNLVLLGRLWEKLGDARSIILAQLQRQIFRYVPQSRLFWTDINKSRIQGQKSDLLEQLGSAPHISAAGQCSAPVQKLVIPSNAKLYLGLKKVLQ